MFTERILKRLKADNNERNNSEYWNKRVENFKSSNDKIDESLIWRTSKEYFDHWDNLHKSTIKLHHKKGKVLDIGCGYGRYHEFITKLGSSYFGVDTSEKMIEEAKKYTESDNFKVYDGIKLPFSDNEFDMIILVICLSSINHIIEEEIIRIVKPNCPILILDENYICTYYK